MLCRNCGSELNEGMIFCPICGQRGITEENKKEEITTVDEGIQVESIPEDVVEVMSEEPPATVVEGEVIEMTPAGELVQVENSLQAIKAGSLQGQEETTYCPNCGKANQTDSTFCYACGNDLSAQQASTQQSISEPKKIRGLRKGISLAIIATAIIVILGVGTLLLKKAPSSDFMYVKENTLWLSDIKSLKTYGFEEKVMESTDPSMLYRLSENRESVRYSFDKKYIFYPKFNDDSYSYSLYCRPINQKDAEAIKIDSDVTEYVLTHDNKVVYKKGDEGNLYIHDLKDKEKLATEIVEFRVSEDSNKIFWMTRDERNIYIQDTNLKMDKVKVDSNVNYMVGYSETLDKLVYMKEDSLYFVKGTDDKVKIASDVKNAYAVNEGSNLKIVYKKYDQNADELKLKELVYDDSIATDQNIHKPNIKDYKREEIVQGYLSNYTRTVTDDSYYTDLEIYNEKLERDDLRQILENAVSEWVKGQVFYYSEETGESVVVKEGYMSESGYDQWYGNEDAIRIFSSLNLEGVEKVKFSDLYSEFGYYTSAYDIEEKIYPAITDSMKVYLQVDEKTTELDLKANEYDMTNVIADTNAQCLYMKKANDEGEITDLVKLSYATNTMGLMEVIDHEVDYLKTLINGNLYYMKEVDEGLTGDLYCNAKKIDYDVAMYSIKKVEESDVFFYVADVNSSYDLGTLKLYDGAETKKIADDVVGDSNFYQPLGAESIAVLVDYNFEKYRGDLKVYNGKELKTVDTDVNLIVR